MMETRRKGTQFLIALLYPLFCMRMLAPSAKLPKWHSTFHLWSNKATAAWANLTDFERELMGQIKRYTAPTFP